MCVSRATAQYERLESLLTIAAECRRIVQAQAQAAEPEPVTAAIKDASKAMVTDMEFIEAIPASKEADRPPPPDMEEFMARYQLRYRRARERIAKLAEDGPASDDEA